MFFELKPGQDKDEAMLAACLNVLDMYGGVDENQLPERKYFALNDGLADHMADHSSALILLCRQKSIAGAAVSMCTRGEGCVRLFSSPRTDVRAA